MSEDSRIITSEMLELKLRSSFGNCEFVQAIDESDGCGSKFQIIVVSSDFVGKTMIAQHRMIQKAIEEERKHIHALTLKPKTPDSWKQEAIDAEL